MRAISSKYQQQGLLRELQDLRGDRVQHEPGGRAEGDHLHPETASQEDERDAPRGLAGGAHAVVREAGSLACRQGE